MALLHLYRVFTHFQIVLGVHSIPEWVSYRRAGDSAGLSWMLCREARGRPGPVLDVEAEQHHVAVLDDIILASERSLPASRAPASPPQATKSS